MDEERLIVLLEARVADFEKKMAQAEKRGSASYTKLRRDSASATAAMEADMVRASGRINTALATTSTRIGAVGIALRGFIAGAVVAGVTGMVGRFGELARSVAEVGNEAKRAGVSAQAFQEWKFVAEQNRIGVDALVDGLKELSLRADEFVQTGKGSGAEAFQRLGYSAEELKTKLEDPSALLLEIIGRLGEFDKAAQIRIADEVFGGTGGERFVELLDQGEAGIRSTIEEAHRLGVVMDDELIERAADLNAMFTSVATTVGSTLKSAIISAAASLVDFLRLWRDFDQQRSESLQSQLTDVQQQRGKIMDEVRSLESDEGLTDNAKDLGFGSASAVTQARITDLKDQVEALTKTEDEIIGVLQSRQPIVVPEAPGGTWTPPTPPPGGFGSSPPSSSSGGGGGGGGGSRSPRERANELDKEIASIEKRTAALQAQSDAQEGLNPLVDDYGYAVEKATALQDLMTAAQEAGIKVTPELRAEMEKLAEAYALAGVRSKEVDEAQEKVRDRAEEIRQMREDTTKGLVQDLVDGKSAADALADALGRIGDKMIDMAMNDLFDPKTGAFGGSGGGGLGGILGSIGGLFGFASGTDNTGGQRGEVRGLVHGQEAVIPLPSGGKVPVKMTGGGGQQRVKVDVSLEPGLVAKIHGDAVDESVRRSANYTNQAGTQLRRDVPKIIAETQRRGGR